MFKRAELVMLSTKDENPVNIPFLKMPEKQKLVKHLAGGQFRTYLQLGFKSQHLYFLSDVKPKTGDYWIDKNGVVQRTNFDLEYGKKIIATTDNSLTINSIYGIDSFDASMFGGKSEKVKLPSLFNLPKPSQSFIQKFVEEYNKGNIITEVMVEHESIGAYANPKYDSDYQLKINKDNTITIRKVKDCWTREEVIELINSWRRFSGENTFITKDTFNKWMKKNL